MYYAMAKSLVFCFLMYLLSVFNGKVSVLWKPKVLWPDLHQDQMSNIDSGNFITENT